VTESAQKLGRFVTTTTHERQSDFRGTNTEAMLKSTFTPNDKAQTQKIMFHQPTDEKNSVISPIQRVTTKIEDRHEYLTKLSDSKGKLLLRQKKKSVDLAIANNNKHQTQKLESVFRIMSPNSIN
jgi:hypothetical protein